MIANANCSTINLVNMHCFGRYIIALIGCAMPFLGWSQVSYTLKSHLVLVSGTSNLHDWTARVEKMAGYSQFVLDNGKITGINGTSFTLDAQSFVSSKGSIMDGEIEQALQAKQYPQITYKPIKISAINEAGGKYRFVSTGILTIAGTSQQIDVDVICKVQPNDDVEVAGTKKMKMTSYRIEPPTALFGALTTADEFSVTFKLIMRPQ